MEPLLPPRRLPRLPPRRLLRLPPRLPLLVQLPLLVSFHHNSSFVNTKFPELLFNPHSFDPLFSFVICALPAISSPYGIITYGLQPDCFENDSTKFSICLDLTSESGKVEPFMAYFASARETWENIIASNGIYYTSTSSLNTVYTATGSYPSVIDGVYISSYVKSIDGEYGILGSAGPLYYLTFDDQVRPLTGLMNFDADDLDWMDADGILEGVIKHEMGHVLGIGT